MRKRKAETVLSDTVGYYHRSKLCCLGIYQTSILKRCKLWIQDTVPIIEQEFIIEYGIPKSSDSVLFTDTSNIAFVLLKVPILFNKIASRATLKMQHRTH